MSALDDARAVLEGAAWTGGFADRYLDALLALVAECESETGRANRYRLAMEQALAEFDPWEGRDPVVKYLRGGLAPEATA